MYYSNTFCCIISHLMFFAYYFTVCLMFSNSQHHGLLWSQRVKQRAEEMNAKTVKRNFVRLHMRNTKFI